MKKLICIFAMLAINSSASFPFILGAVMEMGSGLLESGNYGTGLTRITPFAGLWIDRLGFARLGVSTGSQKEVGPLGASEELSRLDFSAQIGVSAIGPTLPYIAFSYVNAGSYSQAGDSKWNEFGIGFGHRFSLSPFAAVVIEAEHRWIMERYDWQQEKDVSGRRLQMNFGLIANPFP